MPAVWVGVDSGKRTHHCVVINRVGMVLLSRRVNNDETELLELIGAVVDLADGDQVCWATDLNAGGAALLITLLAAHSQRLLYIPGRVVHHAAATYQGAGKTDAKDARIIADQARMRTDLQPVREADQISVDLRMLTARRTDLVCDRVRAINRLRATLLEYFPALERAFDYSKNKAALTLLSEYQTPDRLRRMGATRLAAWLRKRGCRNSTAVAAAAVDAAHQQFTTLPAEPIGSTLVVRLAAEITAIDRDLVELDAQLTDRFRQHEAAEILLSLPGFGPVLAATFLANIGGNLNGFDTVDRLAAVAGLAPVPYDSGRISGNVHRPRRFNRRLLRTCYLAALSSLKNSPSSPRVLRPQTSRRQVPQTSTDRTRQATDQRDLGPTSRPCPLPRTSPYCRLTTALRFPVTGLELGLGRGWTLVDVDHVRDAVLALPDLPRGPPHRTTGT